MLSLANYRLAVTCGLLLAAVLGCGRRKSRGNDRGRKVIRVEGSDTMVNIAQAWAERYQRRHPEISVQVLGGGSGVGIASLIDGNCDLADTSRKMKPKRDPTGQGRTAAASPKEIIVGYDALAIYVHTDNPLDSISMEELAEIYGDDGKIDQLVAAGREARASWRSDDHARQPPEQFGHLRLFPRGRAGAAAGTIKLGSIDQSGSKDVVALVSRTPTAIGYSGMGYATPEVKMLKVSRRRGEPGVAPTVENACNDPIPSPGRCRSTSSASRPEPSRSTSIGFSRRRARRWCWKSGYVPVDPHDVTLRSQSPTMWHSRPRLCKQPRRTAERRLCHKRATCCALRSTGPSRPSNGSSGCAAGVRSCLCSPSSSSSSASRAGAVRQGEPGRVLHQHAMAPDSEVRPAVRHPCLAGGHALGHGAGHGAGRAAGAGRGRLHLRILRRQTQGDA